MHTSTVLVISSGTDTSLLEDANSNSPFRFSKVTSAWNNIHKHYKEYIFQLKINSVISDQPSNDCSEKEI